MKVPRTLSPGTTMDHVIAPDPSGTGSWVLILGCPRPEIHELTDPERGVSGPSFATCAWCEHQTGAQLEHRDPDDWLVEFHPERLACGFSGGAPALG